MNEKQTKALDKVLEALSFYANSNIYWPEPIDLDLEVDMPTLRIANKAHRASEINQDKGTLAREALFEFEGEFKCEYEVRTEI